MALGALFYPKGTKAKPIPFDSLFIPYIYREIYFEGVYVDSFSGAGDMIVLDIGANIGVVTQYMREKAKKVIAVEPSSEHFAALKKNVEYNKWDNVTPVHAAIAEKNGEMSLNHNDSNRTCHSLNLQYGGDSEKVKTYTFSSLMKKHKIDEVDFCKFDVEGYEEAILMSDDFKKVAPKIKKIMVEFHFPEFPKIVDHMLELGYKARRYDSSAIIIMFYR